MSSESKEAVVGFEYDAQHYLPTCVSTQYESPFVVLRYMYDLEDTMVKGASDIAAALRGSKKSSLRRVFSSTRSADEKAAAEAERVAQAMADEAQRVVKRLSAAIDNFMTLLISVTAIRDKQQLHELTSFAEYLMIDDSIVEHPLLKRRQLGSYGLIAENGRLEVRKYVNAQTWKDGYGAKEAKRRADTIFDNSNKWLGDVCRGVCDIVSVLPVTWGLDYDRHETLPNATLGERELRASMDLPFIMIGMLDALRLRDQRDVIIRSMMRRFI